MRPFRISSSVFLVWAHLVLSSRHPSLFLYLFEQELALFLPLLPAFCALPAYSLTPSAPSPELLELLFGFCAIGVWRCVRSSVP